MFSIKYFLILSTLVTSAISASVSSTSQSASANKDVSSTTTGSSLITLLPNNSGVLSVPVTLLNTDSYYNAFFTDAGGNVVGGRVDYLQPNVWLINGESLVDCQVILSYDSSVAKSITTNSPLSFSYSGTTWNVNYCHMNGAITPYLVMTTTIGPQNTTSTYTSLMYSFILTLTLSYGNLVYASGEYVSGNLSFSEMNSSQVSLTNFNFLIANWTERFTGGFGLASSFKGQGLMSYLYGNKLIGGNGYSAYYAPRSNTSDGNGVLVLGGVDSSFISGGFYSFPRVPHNLSNNLVYPIVIMGEVRIKNLATNAEEVLYSGTPTPIIFDSRLRYSYMPYNLILDLAVQTNAIFSSSLNRWIVRCSDIWKVNAQINFQVGPLWINVPLQSFITLSSLSYTNGDQACYLTILPTTFLGYAAFGLNVLSYVYMAMDNASGRIAIANSNRNVSIHDGTVVLNGTSVSSNKTTAALISSGYIPFATPVTLQPQVVFSFGTGNLSLEVVVPARFSGSLLLSNSLISDNFQTSIITSSTATQKKSSSKGLMLRQVGPDFTSVFVYLTLAGIGFVGLTLL